MRVLIRPTVGIETDSVLLET